MVGAADKRNPYESPAGLEVHPQRPMRVVRYFSVFFYLATMAFFLVFGLPGAVLVVGVHLGCLAG